MDSVLSTNMVAVLSFAGIFSAVGAILLGVRDLFFRRDPNAELTREIRRLPAFQDATSLSLPARVDLWLERTLYWSGLGISAVESVLLILLLALSGGGVVFLGTDNELFAAIAGFASVVGVLVFLEIRKRRRLSAFHNQFPAALELLARAVRAGESFDQAIELTGESSIDPVGTEFRRCSRQLELGLGLAPCMRALARRTDLLDVRIFATTVTVHREAGGNLPITLERLAEVMRERAAYQRQLKSVTAAGRFSAMLILVTGPLLFAYMFLFQPQYGATLLDDPLGRILLSAAVVCELVGTFWVSRLVKAEY